GRPHRARAQSHRRRPERCAQPASSSAWTRMTDTPILRIAGLSVALPAGADRQHAVHGLTLDLHPNRTLCVVGESGSGKSLTALAVMGLLPQPEVRAVAGSIQFEGQDLLALPERAMRRIRGRRIGMVFQSPMTGLNPVMRIGDQIAEQFRFNGRDLGVDPRRRSIELLASVGLPDPTKLLDTYPFRLSGGQRQRVMIAMALALEPAVLIADEPTTALDVTTQAQILKLLRELQERYRLAVMFITHDFGVVSEIADEIAVMRHGELVEHGAAGRGLGQPAHPYTKQLLAALPSPAPPRPAPVAAPPPLSKEAPRPRPEPRAAAPRAGGSPDRPADAGAGQDLSQPRPDVRPPSRGDRPAQCRPRDTARRSAGPRRRVRLGQDHARSRHRQAAPGGKRVDHHRRRRGQPTAA